MSPLNELAEIRARLEERAKQRASYQGTASAIDIKHPTISPKEAKSRFPQLRSKSADPEPVTSEVRVAPVFACGFNPLYSVRPVSFARQSSILPSLSPLFDHLLPPITGR
jgi:hypothetical protein